jgi:hypothetical protein
MLLVVGRAGGWLEQPAALRCRRWLRCLVLGGLTLACLLLLPAASHAQVPRPHTPGAPVVSLLTFGPGDQAFAKFGHNAIWVHDPARPADSADLVFNYGTFSFNSPLLALDFLKGNLNYWLSVSNLSNTLAGYRAANRSVSAKRLAFTPEQAREVVSFLYNNARPENRYYRYDYYKDNCSTRVRDLLDRTLVGALAQASQKPTQYSYRDHTRRLTLDAPLLFFGLDLAMGPNIDRPITEWEAMFLPAAVDAKVSEIQVVQGERTMPLVMHEQVLFRATRPDLPSDVAVSLWPWLLAGTSLGAALYLLGRTPSAWSRYGFAALASLVGFVAGAAGAIMMALWAFTDHQVTYWNQNILLCPVWALALPVFAIDLARRQPKRPRLDFRWFAAVALSALLAMLIQGVAPASQVNGPALALLAPCWLGALLGAAERSGRSLVAAVSTRLRANAAAS